MPSISTRYGYKTSTYRRVGIALVVLVTLATLYGAVGHRPAGPVVSTVALGQALSIRGLVAGTIPGRAVVATIGMSQPGSAGSARNSLDVLDVGGGTLQRAVPLAGGIPAVAVDRRARRVFVADAGMAAPATGILRALDGTSGAQLRAVSFSTQPTAIAVDGQAGRVFVVGGGSSGCAGGTCWRDPDVLRMFDARTLRLLRTVPLDADPQDVTADARSGRVFATTPTGVWLLDARTGRVVREVNGVRRVLAIDARSQRAFVTRAGGGVEMLDAATGRDLGPVAVGAGIQVADGMPAAVDAASDQVFLLDTGRSGTATGVWGRGGAVSVVDGASGRLLHTIPVGRVGTLPSAIVLAPERRQAFIADEVANTVSVLDTRRWRVQRVIRAGLAPMALSWDARTGRLVVESIGTPSPRRPDAWAWLPSRVRSWLPFIPRQHIPDLGRGARHAADGVSVRAQRAGDMPPTKTDAPITRTFFMCSCPLSCARALPTRPRGSVALAIGDWRPGAAHRAARAHKETTTFLAETPALWAANPAWTHSSPVPTT